MPKPQQTRHNNAPYETATGKKDFPVAALLIAITTTQWAFMINPEQQNGFVILRSLLLTLTGAIIILTAGNTIRKTHATNKQNQWFINLHATLTTSILIGSTLGGAPWGWATEWFGLGYFGWGTLTAASVSLVAIMVAAATHDNNRRTIITILITTTITQATLGLLQHILQHDPLHALHGGSTATLVHGSLGRNDYLALFILPSTMYLMNKTTAKNTQPWVWITLTLLALAINVTDNRAALIGITAATPLLLYVHRHRALPAATTVILCCLTPIPSQAGISEPGVPGGTSTINTRLGVWNATLQTIPNLPAWGTLGLGPHAYRIMETTHMNPNLMLTTYLLENGFNLTNPQITNIQQNETHLPTWHIQDQTSGETIQLQQGFLYAHNTLLDTFLQGGILNLLAWLTLSIGGITLAFRRGDFGVAAAVLASSVAYLAWFPNIMSDLQHHAWIALAWVKPGVRVLTDRKRYDEARYENDTRKPVADTVDSDSI
jgi:hypothetical protein